eukprot:11267216-Alexandrium_andersonii.AAC.1
MSDIGEPVFSEGPNEDVGEKMTYLANPMEAPAGSQEGLSGRRAPAAPAPEEAARLGPGVVRSRSNRGV